MAVTLDRDRLTASAIDRPDWAGLAWSPWRDLATDGGDISADEPGVYRLRHPAIEGLLAVAEFDHRSISLSRQIDQLASAIYTDRERHVLAAPTAVDPGLQRDLVRIGTRLNAATFEVSYATPSRADRGRWFRRGVLAALIAIHRLATGRWPWPVDCDPSSETVSEDLPSGLDAWTHWEQPRSTEWLGFDWTSPQRLGTIADTEITEHDLYRIWRRSEAEDTLRYIGVRDDRSFARHRPIDGETARCSLASLGGLATPVVTVGIRMELIGAHHLAVGHPPFRQFGGGGVERTAVGK